MGRRPTASGRTRYRRLYVYGFVHPAGGRDLELIRSAADTDWMAPALGEFARWADPEGTRLLVVLLDHAGWQVARRPGVPPNEVRHRLPPCPRELQPAEPLWPRVREAVANGGYDELGAMEPVPVERYRWRIDSPAAVRRAVGSDWAVALDG